MTFSEWRLVRVRVRVRVGVTVRVRVILVSAMANKFVLHFLDLDIRVSFRARVKG